MPDGVAPTRRGRWSKKTGGEGDETAVHLEQSSSRSSRGVGANVFADELFGGGHQTLTSASKHSLAEQWNGASTQVTTRQLLRDSDLLRESCLYIRGFFSSCHTSSEPSPFHHMMSELGSDFKKSMYARSKHPAVTDCAIFLESTVYQDVLRAVLARFPSFTPGYSIVNLYRSGDDCTELHRDNFKAGGNRQDLRLPNSGATTILNTEEATLPHNVTIGVSLGGVRNLVFHHLKSGAEFRFPQYDGDLFAFTTPVNSTFQHGILKERVPPQEGARISVIFWGRVDGEKLL